MRAAYAPDATSARPHRNVRAVLVRRGFRRLLGVRLTSQLGDGVFQGGLVGSVFFNPEQAASPLAIAAAFAVLLVPYSTLGPFVGVFLDRWSRRQSLVVANALRSALVLPSAWLVFQGSGGPGLVVTALAVIALNRFFLAGVSASLPHVVDEPRLVTANSFATTVGSATYSAGLVVAATVFHVAGTGSHQYGVVTGTAMFLYAASALLTLVSFPIEALGPGPTRAVRVSLAVGLAAQARGMVDGFAHLARRPVAWSLVAAQAIHRGLYGVLAVGTLLLYRHYYAVDDPGASMSGLMPVAAAASAGALIAAVITPPLARRLGGQRWVTILLASLVVFVPALGIPFVAALTVAGAAVISLATQGIKIVADTALQVECADDFRGRVFSVNDTAINLPFVAGLFVGAFLLPGDGHSTLALVLISAGYVVAASWFAVMARRHPATTATATTSGDGVAVPVTDQQTAV